MSNTGFITYQSFKLEYHIFGKGSIPLIAFHGFGRHATDFKVFEPLLGGKYTIYAFNLFHHGNSVYPNDRVEQHTLTKDELKNIFSLFLTRFPHQKISIMGYSLGGKIALILTELFSDRVDSLWLFAPDGIKPNFWYVLASKTTLGRHIYKYFIHTPRLFFNLINIFHKMGLINDKIKKFTMHNMDDAGKRILVYTVWLTFKDTNPDMKVCIENINRLHIPVYQFFGVNDQVIKPQLGDWFSKKIHQEDHFHILPTGHQLLTVKTARFINESVFYLHNWFKYINVL